MKPFSSDKEVMIHEHVLSPFLMEPGKVYYIKFPHEDLINFLREQGISCAIFRMERLAGNYFQKRMRAVKVLRKRGDEDYYMNFFSFLPGITPYEIERYGSTERKMFNFEYNFARYDLFIVDITPHDEEGKQEIFHYLHNRELQNKIVIVFEATNNISTDKYAFAEWNEKHFDLLLPKGVPKYPNTISGNRTFN